MRRSGLRFALAFALAGLLVCGLSSNAVAAGPKPPFRQCPAVGADLSCGVLVIIDRTGRITGYYDPSQGPYDGGDDTLVGITNNSLRAVARIPLSGPDIFGFDGDGLCTYIMCRWPNPTGYEGPRNTFTITDANNGFVNFPGGLAMGGSTYFTLEGPAPFQPFVVVHPSNLDRFDASPGQDIGGLDFGNVENSRTHKQTLTITNGGNTPLLISDVVMPAHFDLVRGRTSTCVPNPGATVSVDPDDSCTIEVSFTGASSLERAEELQIVDNAPNSPQYVSLKATATTYAMLDGQVSREQTRAYPRPDVCRPHRVITPFGATIGWGLISHSPQTLVGQVAEAHIATEDATHVPIAGPDSLHFAADYNAFVYPEQGFHRLLVAGNFLVNSEYSQSEVGRIEVEWERAGHGHDGLPEWAWPTVGDKIKAVGWYILDCSHGRPTYRSEIHPPLFLATYRNAALAPLGGWSGRLGSADAAKHEETLVDVFASGYGGGAFGNEFGPRGKTHQPVSLYTYDFDVMAPPKPSPMATLAPPDVQHMQGPPGTSAGPLTYTTTSDQRGYHFTLKLPQPTHLLASEVFGARIRVKWIDPNAPVIKNYHEFRVDLVSLHVIEDLTTTACKLLPGCHAKWGLYAYVNELGRGSIISGSGENVNHESYKEVSDGDVISLAHVPPFIVTTVDNQPLHVSFRVTYFNASRYLCTWCGGGDSGGTASAFYDTSLPFTGTQTLNLAGTEALAGGLGNDEWSSGCKCFEVAFRITKIK